MITIRVFCYLDEGELELSFELWDLGVGAVGDPA